MRVVYCYLTTILSVLLWGRTREGSCAGESVRLDEVWSTINLVVSWGKILLLKGWVFFTKRTENWWISLKYLVCDLLSSLQGEQKSWLVKGFHSNWSFHLLFKKYIHFLCLGFDGMYEPISTLWVSVLIRSYVIRSCQVKRLGVLWISATVFSKLYP